MGTSSDKILWDVMEEHLEEAGFLWTMWERALDAPDYVLDELAAREERRLVAHLDALVIGGAEVAEQLLLPALEQDEAETSVAAGLALTAGKQGAAVLGALGAAEEMTPGVWGQRRALELSALDSVVDGLEELCATGGSPSARALALEALAFHGAHTGPLPAALLESEEPHVMRALLRAAPVAPGDPPRDLVQRGLSAEDAGVRDAALSTGVLLEIEAARERCTLLVEQRQPGCRMAMEVEGLLGGAAGMERLATALEVPELQHDALWSLGFCGSVEAADLCVATMKDHEDLAAHAAESLCAITGLNLKAAGQARPPQPADDEDDALSLSSSPEDDLLLPDVEKVCAWWEQHRGALPPGERRIMGQQPGLDAVARALLVAPMWRRHGLALELTARARGASPPRLQTRTWCVLQRRMVHELAQVEEPDLGLDWGCR